MCGRGVLLRRYPSTMAGDTPGLKLSEVSKLCGVEVDTLRVLIRDDQLRGVTRASNGHVYLRPDTVPNYQELVTLLEAQLAHHLRRAQAAHRRVAAEVEAVGNDIELALENPYDQLGDDLTTFRHYSNEHNQTTLVSALGRLETALLDVRIYSDALRRTRTVT